MIGPPDPSVRYLLGRLAVVESAVRAAVAERRERDPSPDDAFRGLYLTDEEVDRLLAGPHPPAHLPASGAPAELRAEVEADANRAVADGAELRLRALSASAGLDDRDLDILLVALAPDLDPRFERFYGYLHDDVTRRRASIGLALELAGLSPISASARRRLAGGPLLDAGLVDVVDPDRPFLTRSLLVPDRVAAHLLGDDRPDHALAGLLVDPVAGPCTDPEPLARALGQGASPAYLREQPGSSAVPLALAALARLGLGVVVLDMARAEPSADPAALAKVAGREALLRRAGLVVRPVEALAERGVGAVRAFAEAAGPVLLAGRSRWDPAWAEIVPLLVDVAAPRPGEQAEVWRRHLDEHHQLDAAAETYHFRLTPEQVRQAALAARHAASLDGGRVDGAQLRAGARAQNAAGLENRARRIEPGVGWDDLVLPPAARDPLRELAARARHRHQVIEGWRMRPGGGRGQGITALFAGDSGTGKTMSAEVIAGDLGLDLYAVNLAAVVDKYVGETEKNLERILSEADGVNAVLLFDEADALFGKRSEVRDAHDRYANIEVAYLLQRMETFDGLAILATNLRANLDEAFTRRLDAIVDFPLPDEAHRRLLWDRCLGPLVPRAGDVDLDFCARQFELSGGNIRSIAITAAYLAAAAGRPVSMLDLMRATRREYRKLGRLCVDTEFGPYLRLDSVPIADP